KYGTDEVHSGGLRVYTTLDMDLQAAANQAALDGLAAYERRHGWQGHLENIFMEGQAIASYRHPDWDQPGIAGSYTHAVVTAASASGASVKFGALTADLSPADVAWTKKPITKLLAPGYVVYVKLLSLDGGTRAHVSLEQDSGAQAALLAIDNAT